MTVTMASVYHIPYACPHTKKLAGTQAEFLRNLQLPLWLTPFIRHQRLDQAAHQRWEYHYGVISSAFHTIWRLCAQAPLL